MFLYRRSVIVIFNATSERGFGVVGFLVLLPLLVSVLAAIAGAALLLRADAHLKHECRVSVLNSQRTVAEKLRQLMSMNPEATALREEYLAAKAEVAAAEGYPLLLPPALAHLELVETARTAFSIRQRALLVQGAIESSAAPMKAKMAVVKGLSEEAHANGVTPPPVRSSTRRGHFDVEATPKFDQTPDYNPSQKFTDMQTVDVDVKADVGPLLPAWLRNLLPNGQLEISSHCQATIQKQEDKWIETLNAVK
jgi:hypothetical protein